MRFPPLSALSLVSIGLSVGLSVGLAANVALAHEVVDSAELAAIQNQLTTASSTASLNCTSQTTSDAFESRTETYSVSKAYGFLVAINNGHGGKVHVADIGSVRLVTFSFTTPRQEHVGSPPGAFESERSETYELRDNGTVLSKVSAKHSSVRSLYWPERTNYISINQVTHCGPKN